MQANWLLKCGSDTVGTVTWNGGEMWHNYGRLEPGPDYERYRAPLEEFWAADQACDVLLYSNGAVPDEDLELHEVRKERAQQALDQFMFYFEDPDTHQVQPIHEFHPEGNNGSVYWRWGQCLGLRK